MYLSVLRIRLTPKKSDRIRILLRYVFDVELDIYVNCCLDRYSRVPDPAAAEPLVRAQHRQDQRQRQPGPHLDTGNGTGEIYLG